jgi:uncharacterized protein
MNLEGYVNISIRSTWEYLQMQDTKLKEIIDRILEVITPDKIILFGSRARGTVPNNSDYDLMIVKSGIDNELKLEQKIYRNFIGLGIGVDIIVTTPEKLEKYKDTVGYIYKQVFNEGITVHG